MEFSYQTRQKYAERKLDDFKTNDVVGTAEESVGNDFKYRKLESS